MTINTQRVSSIVRQVLAYAGIVMGILTASVQGVKLPPYMSAIIAIGGAVLINIEHYVSDPSTGTPVPPAPTGSPAMPAKGA